MTLVQCHDTSLNDTVDGFIFVGTNFRGLSKNDTFLGLKIRCHSTVNVVIFAGENFAKMLARRFTWG